MYPDLDYVWSLFVFASDTRSQGDPISPVNIEATLNIYGIRNEQRRQNRAGIIRILDKEKIKHQREKEDNNA